MTTFRTFALLSLSLFSTVAQAQTWTTLTNAPPAGLTNCMLLTDGGVMCQSGTAWYKLTPNSSGSYAGGTWSTLASLPSSYNPDAYATAVLADGRLVIVGGEYNKGSFALSNMGAIYDPKANTWTMLTPPTTGSPNYFQCIGDAPSVVLADGRFLIGSKLYQNLAVLDPSALTWSIVSETGKNDTFNSEEGWTLLPDGSVFTLDVAKAPAAERFLLSGPTTGTWVSAGSTLQDLHTPTTSSPLTAPGCPVYNPPGEMGPALLRPDGTVFAIGASGYTAIYTPPAAGSIATGSWAIGPAMPSGLNVEDGPGALLPSGHVLFGGSPGDSGKGLQYFEFDGTNLVSVPAPANAANDATYYTQLLVLPTGQVLFIDGSTKVQLYNPAGSPTYNPAWAPAVTSVASTLIAGTTYPITGTQFNGLSAGTAYGDESENATNYPLVRITDNATGHVFYARTHGHSTMGVATGTTPVSTNFDVPANIESGPSTLQVVANGIPSSAVAVNVGLASITPPTGGFTALTSGSNTLTFTVTNGGTLGTPVIFTEGVPSAQLTSPDFSLAAAGTTCVGPVTATSCNIAIQFTPQYPGLRRGAVEIFDANNNLLTTAFIYGVGTGTQSALAPASVTTLVSTGSPRGVAVDASGNVYYGDTNASQVYKLSPGGTPASLLLGLNLSSPFGVALDAAGNLYIADAGDNRIVKLPYGSATASVLNISGLSYPEGVAIDGAGNLLIANTRGTASSGNGNVIKVAAGGTGTQTTIATGGLAYPAGVAVDAAGDVFFADWSNNRVVELPAPGGASISLGSGLNHASAVAVDSAGDVFIADENNNRIVELPGTSRGPGTGTQLVAATGLSTPYSLAFDGKGDLFIANVGSNGATNGSVVDIPVGGIAQTITFGPIGSQAIGNTLSLSATASSGLAVSFTSSTPSVCTVSGTTASMIAGGTCTITASQAGNGTYAAALPVSQSFTVAFNTQTVNFTAIGTQTVGSTVTLSATASSGLPVTFTSSTAAVCTVAGTTASMVASGTCSLTASQAGNSKYGPASASQSFAVNGKPQSISFGTISAQAVGTPLTLSATSTSGLAVTFASTTTAVCTVVGTAATFIAAGSCTVTASQAGNSAWAAATPVSQTFTVSASSVKVTGATLSLAPGKGGVVTVTISGLSTAPTTLGLGGTACVNVSGCTYNLGGTNGSIGFEFLNATNTSALLVTYVPPSVKTSTTPYAIPVTIGGATVGTFTLTVP